MNKPNLKSCLAAVALAFAATGPASAVSNAEFDAQFNSWLSNAQQQNANSIMALRQQHLQANYPRLVAEYRQLMASGRANVSFEQYVYYDLMTARGTNVAGALKAQQDQFNGNQIAHGTVMSGYNSYNVGSAANSARTSAAIGNWTTGAVRGQAAYVDPNTGATTMLPYYSQPGQVVNNGGTYYSQDAQGTYWQWTGNGWSRMNAGR